MPESHNEQRQAHAIAQQPHQTSGNRRRNGRQRCTGSDAECKIDRPCQQPFELDNLQRVRQRHLAREIVVQAPSHARTQDRERPQKNSIAWAVPTRRESGRQLQGTPFRWRCAGRNPPERRTKPAKPWRPLPARAGATPSRLPSAPGRPSAGSVPRRLPQRLRHRGRELARGLSMPRVQSVLSGAARLRQCRRRNKEVPPRPRGASFPAALWRPVSRVRTAPLKPGHRGWP